MLARVQSFILHGIDAQPCEIEVDIDDTALQKETVVGLPDAAVKESLERVRAAIANAGFSFPAGRVLANLAPADVRKEGPLYDLPMALGLLIAHGAVAAPGPGDAELALDPRAYLIAGELALDGRLRPIRGAIAMASLARSRGLRGVVVPAANADEAAVVEGVEVVGVETLSELVGLVTGELEVSAHPGVDLESLLGGSSAGVDFAEVRGQEGVKRALVIACAAMHNILLIGPPGTGKTMMAKALPGILPAMSASEALEVTRVYSSAGVEGGGGGGHGGLVTRRPVRSPHHTASSAAIIGGGAVPRPGEISLAHRGVLFLDELPEFPRFVLDTLRQPLEDGCVTIARAKSTVRFPASFMLVAAMNPTPRGDVGVDSVSRAAMERYLSRLSRPLVDRIDVHVEAPAVPWKELSSGEVGSSTAEMRERVMSARARQRARQGDRLNSALSGKELDELAPMSDAARGLLGQAISELGLSARAYDKIRRVARTIADLEGDGEALEVGHIAEAVQYRLLDRLV